MSRNETLKRFSTKRSPWLTMFRGPGFPAWTDSNGNEWLCADRIKDWFTIPKSAKSIRVVLTKERSSPDAYRIKERLDQSIVLETSLGNHWALLYQDLYDFVRAGLWISIEYKEE